MKIVDISGLTVAIFIVGKSIQATVQESPSSLPSKADFQKSFRGQKVISALKYDFWAKFAIEVGDDYKAQLEIKPIKVFGADAFVIILK